MTKLITILLLLPLSTLAETIIGHGDVTNRITLEKGEVALIQTAVVDPWSATERERKSIWESGGVTADFDEGSNHGGYALTAPLLLAGPGSLSVSYAHVITYQKLKMTNVTTVIV